MHRCYLFMSKHTVFTARPFASPSAFIPIHPRLELAYVSHPTYLPVAARVLTEYIPQKFNQNKKGNTLICDYASSSVLKI